jgi:SAM-dependent methyltransferase
MSAAAATATATGAAPGLLSPALLSVEEAARMRAFERARHDALAPTYAGFFAHVTAQAIPPLLAALRCGPGVRLLDVAAGPGALAAAAAALGALAEGVDLSPGMVALAAASHPGLRFREAAVEQLPYPAGSFDAVAINFGIGHFPRPTEALAECRRVLAPGGRLAMSWWDVPARQRLQGLFREASAEVGVPAPAAVPAGHSNLRFCASAELLGVLAEAGFTAGTVAEHAGEHVLPDVEALWQGGLGSLAVTAAAISELPAERQAAVRAALDRHAAPYLGPRGLVLPVAFKVASGVVR